MNFDSIRLIISTILSSIAIILFIASFKRIKTKFTTKFISSTAIFATISIILYVVPVFHFSLPFFPAFLEIHLDEIPALIAGFAYGPWSGFFIIIIKTIVKLPLTSSFGVGEFADLFYSLAFVIPSSLIYKKIRHIKGAFVSIIVGTLIQIIISSFCTTFIMLDLYSMVYPGLSKEIILNMCQIINPNIKSLGIEFLLIVALPFNFLKDILISIITLILYKKLHTLIDKLIAKNNF